MDLSFNYSLVLKVRTIHILQEDFNEFNYYCGEASRESTLEGRQAASKNALFGKGRQFIFY